MMSMYLRFARRNTLFSKSMNLACVPTQNLVGTEKPSELTVIQGPRSISRRSMSLLNNVFKGITSKDDEFTIHTYGLSLESVDSDGNPDIANVIRLGTFLDRTEHADIGLRTFDWSKLTSDKYPFTICSEISVEKEMYNLSIPKNPLDVRCQLGHIGTTSVTFVISVVVPSTGQTILRNSIKVVITDVTTRPLRPIPLPEWWKEKYSRSAILKEPLVIPEVKLSAKALTYPVKVAWGHVSPNNETIHTFYIQYCINALHSVIKDGKLKEITKDVIKSGIRFMRNKYTDVSYENDDLTVHVCPSGTGDNTVHFYIRKDGNSIYQSTFMYYGN